MTQKYRFDRNGRRSFDTAVEYPTAEPAATEKTRTAKAAVRATCYLFVSYHPCCQLDSSAIIAETQRHRNCEIVASVCFPKELMSATVRALTAGFGAGTSGGRRRVLSSRLCAIAIE